MNLPSKLQLSVANLSLEGVLSTHYLISTDKYIDSMIVNKI